MTKKNSKQIDKENIKKIIKIMNLIRRYDISKKK